MQGERQAASHGAYRTPAPGGPCPHARGLDGAPEELRNRYALAHIRSSATQRRSSSSTDVHARGRRYQQRRVSGHVRRSIIRVWRARNVSSSFSMGRVRNEEF